MVKWAKKAELGKAQAGDWIPTQAGLVSACEVQDKRQVSVATGTMLQQ